MVQTKLCYLAIATVSGLAVGCFKSRELVRGRSGAVLRPVGSSFQRPRERQGLATRKRESTVGWQRTCDEQLSRYLPDLKLNM